MFESALQSVLGQNTEKFEQYLDRLETVLGHRDRVAPFRTYCRGLVEPDIRKSIESISKHVSPAVAAKTHQSLHHFVAKSNWRDRTLLCSARNYGLPALQADQERLVWAICDSGMIKHGKHTAGVFRKYCGRVGRRTNCQSAVILFACGALESLPIGLRLYLPETWTADMPRRRRAGIPDSVKFQTRAQIAVRLIKQALEEGSLPSAISAGISYGNSARFRRIMADRRIQYALEVGCETEVIPASPPLSHEERADAASWSCRTDSKGNLMTVSVLGQYLPANAYHWVRWQKMGEAVTSRFAALRVRLPLGGEQRKTTNDEEWLLVEWPRDAISPRRYWLSTLPETSGIDNLVDLATRVWLGEAGYLALKDEIGLGHYEGRGWRGFHHHAALCIAIYAFLLRLKKENLNQSEINRIKATVVSSLIAERSGTEHYLT